MPTKKNAKDKQTLQLLRGFKDIMPDDQPAWLWVRQLVKQIAASYGYRRLDTPILEMENLFARTIGEESDIVEKEMFVFTDRGGNKVTLRPETTASFARAYVEHGLVNRPQPVKMYYFGPQFRYDRPQAGRYRQFHQFGFESFGEQDAINDAQLIQLAHSLLTYELKLPISLQVNSIGDKQCRPQYIRSLNDYYKSRKNALCDECKIRLKTNPLRLLDCKEKDCQELASSAPQTVDHLCEECRDHFVRLLEYLDELELGYELNPKLVRGLDYYTKTVFEIWPANDPEGSQSALIGGGRYDNLVALVGGRPTPAVGFAAGVERIISQLHKNNVVIPKADQADVFLTQLGDKGRKKSLKLFEDMRRAGINVSESLSKDSIKSQLEIANNLACKFSIILGQKEIMDETILIRDMENGIQEVVDFAKAIPEIKKRLDKYQSSSISNHEIEHPAEEKGPEKRGSEEKESEEKKSND
ncbi:histidine--tRNA ligase [Patescibacteria group bacterium]